jgi:hypothetical protein
LTGRNDTEKEHIATQEDVRSYTWHAHDDVAWDLNQDKGNEEYPQRCIVAIGRHLERFLKAFDSGIGDYGLSALSWTYDD